MPYRDLEKRRAAQKAYRARNPRYTIGAYRRKYHLKSKYGITEEHYDRILLFQQFRCAICNTDNPGHRHGTKYFTVDHDHVTGKIRGLLCQDCNHGIGKFKDNSELLRKAILYLDG